MGKANNKKAIDEVLERALIIPRYTPDVLPEIESDNNKSAQLYYLLNNSIYMAASREYLEFRSPEAITLDTDMFACCYSIESILPGATCMIVDKKDSWSTKIRSITVVELGEYFEKNNNFNVFADGTDELLHSENGYQKGTTRQITEQKETPTKYCVEVKKVIAEGHPLDNYSLLIKHQFQLFDTLYMKTRLAARRAMRYFDTPIVTTKEPELISLANNIFVVENADSDAKLYINIHTTSGDNRLSSIARLLEYLEYILGFTCEIDVKVKININSPGDILLAIEAANEVIKQNPYIIGFVAVILFGGGIAFNGFSATPPSLKAFISFLANIKYEQQKKAGEIKLLNAESGLKLAQADYTKQQAQSLKNQTENADEAHQVEMLLKKEQIRKEKRENDLAETKSHATGNKKLPEKSESLVVNELIPEATITSTLHKSFIEEIVPSEMPTKATVIHQYEQELESKAVDLLKVAKELGVEPKDDGKIDSAAILDAFAATVEEEE